MLTKRLTSTTAQILIVDDHPLVRRGLAELIASEPDLEVWGQAASGEEALQLLARNQPDLMVVDISLKGINGLELIKRVRLQFPEILVLVSSMHDESLFGERALLAGASGYINKEEATDRVLDAIRQILDGRIYMSQTMVRHVLQPTGEERTPSLLHLSDRELEVFTLIGQGVTTRQIAERLKISTKTVETHRENIKAKLSLKTGMELTRRAVQWVLENT